MLLAIYLAITILFLLLGVRFSKGKGAWLIAGYNTASPAKRETVDGKALCRFMGKLMFALAACWLVIVSGDVFRSIALLRIGLALFFAVTITGVIYVNTGNRFEKTGMNLIRTTMNCFPLDRYPRWAYNTLN